MDDIFRLFLEHFCEPYSVSFNDNLITFKVKDQFLIEQGLEHCNLFIDIYENYPQGVGSIGISLEHKRTHDLLLKSSEQRLESFRIAFIQNFINDWKKQL